MQLLFDNIDQPGLNTLAVYQRQRGGYEMLRKALDMEPADVLSQLQASGLRGRGGAGFAMGTKASFLPKGDMDKYVVCNAGEYDLQATILEEALEEAKAANLLGSLDMVVHRGAGAYICGEETGLLDALEGKLGNPRLKPPFPANQGLYQGPTLINNVETLCNAPLIIEHGAEWFRKFGEGNSTGTKIVSVSGNVQRPGNYEIELGVKVREVIYGLAGGPPEGRELKCFFPGGSSAPVLTAEHLDLPFTYEAMAEAGSMLGTASMIVVDDSQPLVPLALRLAEFYRHESCGKCVPCREGTNWTVKMLERIDMGEGTPMDLDILEQVQGNIMGNCLCVLGDSMAMPVSSMLQHFREEFEQHMEDARTARDLEELPPLGAAELASEPAAGQA